MPQKNVLIFGAIALIVVLAILFVFFPGNAVSFEDGFSELKQIWVEKGIDIPNIAGEAEKISSLSIADLSFLKGELEVLKNKFEGTASLDKQALVDVSNIYISLVDSAAKSKSVQALEAQIGDVGFFEGCDHTDLFKQRNSLQKEHFESIKNLSARVDSFIQKFPQENMQTGFHSLELNINELNNYTIAMETSLTELVTLCAEENQ